MKYIYFLLITLLLTSCQNFTYKDSIVKGVITYKDSTEVIVNMNTIMVGQLGKANSVGTGVINITLHTIQQKLKLKILK